MKKIALISLGCEKNLVDSESILGVFNKSKYEIVDNLKEEFDKKIDTTYSTRDGNMICTLSIDVTQ